MDRRMFRTACMLLPIMILPGCASSSPEAFVEANKQPPRPAPPALVQSSPLAKNRVQQVPGEHEAEVAATPWRVIEKANRASTQNPDMTGFFNAIMLYDYVPGSLYQVYAAPLRLTDIQLQPGEKLVGKPAAGDTVRWILGTGKSKVEGQDQQHIYVKATRPGLKTTLVVTTDRRTYHIELHSYRETYMAAVQWRYPDDELHIPGGPFREDTVASNVDIRSLDFGYEVRVKRGRNLDWKPLKVFDDGRKTFIQFPEDMLTKEAPVLFVVSKSGETQLVNYRVKDEYFVVDRLFRKAELRLGSKDQDIVRITKI